MLAGSSFTMSASGQASSMVSRTGRPAGVYTGPVKIVLIILHLPLKMVVPVDGDFDHFPSKA